MLVSRDRFHNGEIETHYRKRNNFQPREILEQLDKVRIWDRDAFVPERESEILELREPFTNAVQNRRGMRRVGSLWIEVQHQVQPSVGASHKEKLEL